MHRWKELLEDFSEYRQTISIAREVGGDTDDEEPIYNPEFIMDIPPPPSVPPTIVSKWRLRFCEDFEFIPKMQSASRIHCIALRHKFTYILPRLLGCVPREAPAPQVPEACTFGFTLGAYIPHYGSGVWTARSTAWNDLSQI